MRSRRRILESPDAALKRHAGGLAKSGFRRLPVARDPTCLSSFYDGIPFRYPPLFEALCLSYSWSDAVVGEVELAANPPGADLDVLASRVRYDRHLWEYLSQHGHLIFGRMSGGR
jgi:hypothetical protein